MPCDSIGFGAATRPSSRRCNMNPTRARLLVASALVGLLFVVAAWDFRQKRLEKQSLDDATPAQQGPSLSESGPAVRLDGPAEPGPPSSSPAMGDPERVHCPNAGDRWGRVVTPEGLAGMLVTSEGGEARVPWSSSSGVVVQFSGERVKFTGGLNGGVCRVLSRQATVHARGRLVTEGGETWSGAEVEVCGVLVRTDVGGAFALDAPPGECELRVRSCQESAPRTMVVVPENGDVGDIRASQAGCGDWTPTEPSSCARANERARDMDWAGEAGDPSHQHIFDELAQELTEIGCEEDGVAPTDVPGTGRDVLVPP